MPEDPIRLSENARPVRAHHDENAHVAGFYDDLVTRFGNDPRALDWSSRISQEKRFAILLEIADLTGSRVLDVGCGLADLYAFLQARRVNVRYTGYDIAPNVVRSAKERYADLELRLVDLMAEEVTSAEFDFVLASGIFNLRPVGSYAYLEQMVHRMYRLCRQGVAFNSLSSRSNLATSGQFLADPAATLDICLRITSNAVLRHDYMPHDFTVYLYKG